LSKNIYIMFREYNRLLTKPQKAKYLAGLSYDLRETFKNLVDYANKNERFENIYDGWIDNLDDELVILEVYSVILNTRRSLNKFCVDDTTYKDFVNNKKNMLLLLLTNEQYRDAKLLLDVHMFNESFKQRKLSELRDRVLEYLTRKRITLPKKIIIEIYKWADEHKLPSYLTTNIEGDFKFKITLDVLPIEELKKAVEMELKSTKLPTIVDNLVLKNRVK